MSDSENSFDDEVVEITEVVDVIEVDGVEVTRIVDVIEGDGIEIVDVVAMVDGEIVEEDILVLEEIDNSLTLPVWEPTGDAEVDAALEELATVDQSDSSEHIAIFESVHRRLHDRLSDLSSGS